MPLRTSLTTAVRLRHPLIKTKSELIELATTIANALFDKPILEAGKRVIVADDCCFWVGTSLDGARPIMHAPAVPEQPYGSPIDLRDALLNSARIKSGTQVPAA